MARSEMQPRGDSILCWIGKEQAVRRSILFLVSILLLQPAVARAERHSLIVISENDHKVYDLNPATGQVLKEVTLRGAPREAIFSWDEKTLFVSVPDAEQVAIVDVATFKQTGQITSPEFKRPAGGLLGAPLGLA